MSRAPHVGDELTALLDGALDPAAEGRVRAHLAACPACRAERERLAGAVAALASLPPPPSPSPGFEQRFYARLARERATPRGLARLPWRFLAPLAAAGAAAAVLAGFHFRAERRDVFIAAHLDLFESYEAVASADAVSPGGDDADVIAHLDELEGEE